MAISSILIIDDHSRFRKVLRGFIEMYFKDADIREAQTGEEGYLVAVQQRPDVSLIDICLPDMQGMETASRIREEVPEGHIIMMSMRAPEYLELGDTNRSLFMGKEIMDSELIPVLQQFLNSTRKEERSP